MKNSNNKDQEMLRMNLEYTINILASLQRNSTKATYKHILSKRYGIHPEMPLEMFERALLSDFNSKVRQYGQ